MKMKLTFLLLASVFFVSCGMPTIFAPSTSEYTLLKTTPDTATTYVQGKLDMHLAPGPTHVLLSDSSTKGPSLMFFYAFGGAEASENQFINEASYLTSNFRTEFMANGYEGKVIGNPSKLVSTGSGDKKAYLYGVNNGSGTQFKAISQYVLYAQDHGASASLDSFTLTKTDIGTPEQGYTLNLTWIENASPPTFVSNAIGDKLYAFDGKPFPLLKTDIENSTSGEYDFVKDDLSGLQIHLFAAFFISGPFSNYFWSKLEYLGAIPIALV